MLASKKKPPKKTSKKKRSNRHLQSAIKERSDRLALGICAFLVGGVGKNKSRSHTPVHVRVQKQNLQKKKKSLTHGHLQSAVEERSDRLALGVCCAFLDAVLGFPVL